MSDEQKVTFKDLSLINPYHAFIKPVNPITRSIKQLIKHTPRNVKEYIQSTKFSHYNLPTTNQEHFVSLKSLQNIQPSGRHKASPTSTLVLSDLPLLFMGEKDFQFVPELHYWIPGT